MRILKAVLVGLAVGVAVAVPVNLVPWWDPFGFWGLFFGSFAAVVAFGLALMLLARGSRRASGAGRKVSAAGLAIFGALVASWILTWGVAPFTLEGAWIYPLAVVPLVGSALLLRQRRSNKERTWDRPPAR